MLLMTSHAEMKADKIDQWLPIPISGANLPKWCWCYSYITPLSAVFILWLFTFMKSVFHCCVHLFMRLL